MEKKPNSTLENIKNKTKNGFNKIKTKTKELASKTKAVFTSGSQKKKSAPAKKTASPQPVRKVSVDRQKKISGTGAAKSTGSRKLDPESEQIKPKTTGSREIKGAAAGSSSATILYKSDEVLKGKGKKGKGALPLPENQIDPNKSYGHIFRRNSKDSFFLVGTVITIAKIIGVCLVLIAVAAIGAVFGVAKAYLGTTPELDLVAISDNDLTSYIYDGNGELITTYAGVENRDYATLQEIPDILQKAVISIEDIRFYSHPGVDIKGLIGAFVGNISSNSVSGGSTITQQLIKNKLLTNEKSYKRKIQEMSLAIQLEKVYTKDQILEAYLNSMPLGGTDYGVKAAALDYFGKELNELTLRECACLAGITQYPWKYNPRRAMYVTHNMKALNDRINRVLQKMYENGYITLDEKEAAERERLTVNEKSIVNDLYAYPHFVEYGIYDVVTHFLKQRGLEDNTANRNVINNELRTSGYHIYLTVDPEMQELVQTTLSNARYPSLGKNDNKIIHSDGTETIQPQSAAVVYDYRSGELKAIVGGRDEPTTAKSLNRAYQSHMPVGSSIKPIGVYGPAFDLGEGLGTIIANIPAKIPGWGTNKGYPTTSTGTFGPTSIRKGIVSSLNIVAARTLMTKVGLETSYNYLLSLGINKDYINIDGVGLALGSSGITVIEMAGAYSAIANAGVYKEPLSFSKVVDDNGNIVLSADEIRDEHQVFKRSTSYMLVTALTEAVKSGTGWRAKLKNITTAGKTGTVANNKGVFFAGFTGYYISTIWVGHDNFKTLPHSYGGDTAAPIWKEYMSVIHEGLEDKAILEGKAKDYDVVSKSVCAVSGLKPGAGCPTHSDYFGSGGGPKKTCDMHVSANICTKSGEIAGIYCPADSIKSGSGVIIPKDSPYALLEPEKLKSILPNAILGEFDQDRVCSYHTYEWAVQYERTQIAKQNAGVVVQNAEDFIVQNRKYLTEAQISSLQSIISRVNSVINNSEATESDVVTASSNLNSAIKTLTDAVNRAKEEEKKKEQEQQQQQQQQQQQNTYP